MSVKENLIENDETSLAGCLLYDPDRALSEIADLKLTPECFTRPECRLVFQAVQRMTANSIPLELFAVVIEAGIDAKTGEALVDSACVAGHARYHGIKLRDAMHKREAMKQVKAADGAEALRMVFEKILAALPVSSKAALAVNAADWLECEPPPLDYVLEQVFERDSRVLLVGSSKTRKSFLALQLAICVATGIKFLSFNVPKPRRVLLVNLENSDGWQHRRFRGMCATLGVTKEMLGDRLSILNGRNRCLTLEKIEEAAIRFRAEVIILDPLYKLDGGADESDMAERKRLVAELERMSARSGAALVVVHHDPKGSPGDRNVRDRGAGSAVINRDVDATLAMTMWAEADENADNMMVLSVLARYSPPRNDMSLVFTDLAFIYDPDRTPCKATSKTRAFATPPFNESAALALVAERGMTKMAYREAIKGLGGTRDGREAWLQKAFQEGRLVERRKGKRDKLISTPQALELDLSPNTSDTSRPSET